MVAVEPDKVGVNWRVNVILTSSNDWIFPRTSFIKIA